jgi:hypothetical protein
MMAGPGNILIKVGAETAGAVHSLSSLNSALGDTMSSSEKMGAGLQKAALPAAAALTAIGAAAFSAGKAAMEDAASQAKLAGALERTAGANDAAVKGAEDYITKLEMSTGVADDELRPALAKLASATGDVATAQKALGIAVDISAQSGKDLNVVAAGLARAYDGSTTSLKRLVPGLDEATLKSKDMTAIMAELGDKTKGAAAEAAQAEPFKLWSVQMQELKESLGAGLLPVMQQFAGVLQAVTGFASEHTTAIQAIVAAVAALAGGILAANIALKAYEAAQVAIKVATAAWTAAQWLLNAALDANPIGAVILAVAALGAAIVVAYKKSETFREIVNAAFHAVEVAVGALADAAGVAFGAIRSAIGGVESAVHTLGSAFGAVESAATSAWGWIKDHWQLALFALGPIGAAIALIATNFDKIKAAASAAGDVVTSVMGAMESAINAVLGAVNALLGAIASIHFPSLPGWMHLPFGLAAAPAPAARGARAFAPTAAATGGLTVNVFGAVDPEGTARAIRRILRDHDRRQGRTL